ncbi:MAG TPA: hypothetical protein VIK72_12945 [Clostridiaceae bacterium]
MSDLCKELSSNTFNWNAAVGSISAISFSTEEPAINIHSYKFYFARAIWFELYSKGKKLKPNNILVTWYPHKIESKCDYGEFSMNIQAFFVDEEIVAIDYQFSASSPLELDMSIYGVVRNGQSNDTFFDFRGQVEPYCDSAVNKQEIDIPDFRMNPMGPFRHYTHNLIWLVDANSKIDISNEEIEGRHPERINIASNKYKDGINHSNYWLIKKQISIMPTITTGKNFFIGTRWMGPEKPVNRDYQSLQNRINLYKQKSLASLESKMLIYWNELLQKVPPTKEKYNNQSEYQKLYYQAWVCIFQNITNTLVTSRKTIKGPSVSVGKVCSCGFGPAQWETSLGGFLLSFVNSEIGVGVIESVINSIEPDGFIPEDLIFNRDVKLSPLEASMLEYIYNFTQKSEYLKRNYDNLFKQTLYHIKHPEFYYLTTPSYPWSLIDSYYGLLSLERIAIIIGKGNDEIIQIRELTEEVSQMLAALIKEHEENRLPYSQVYDYLEEDKVKTVMEFIKNHSVPPTGQFFLYGSPDGKDEREIPDSFKMVGYYYFIQGLENLHEDEYLDVLVAQTFAGLSKNGDFWESYYVNGEAWGNGPMSIFGAFGWIWSVMEKPYSTLQPLVF